MKKNKNEGKFPDFFIFTEIYAKILYGKERDVIYREITWILSYYSMGI